MAFHPCRQQDVPDRMEVHKHQGHLPYRPQSLHLLLRGYTSNHSCEVEVYFFKALPIVSLLTGTSSTIFACSSNSRSVQRKWPSGAGLHAISMIRASARPSNFRRAWSELTLRLSEVMPSIPFSEYSFTVLVIVAIQTQFVLADCSWVRTLPCASSKSIKFAKKT